MQKLILYSTLGCHLCELAKQQLEPLIDHYLIQLQEVDIANDEGLLKSYGIKIPVLYIERSQRELCWPFDVYAIDQFLQQI